MRTLSSPLIPMSFERKYRDLGGRLRRPNFRFEAIPPPLKYESHFALMTLRRSSSRKEAIFGCSTMIQFFVGFWRGGMCLRGLLLRPYPGRFETAKTFGPVLSRSQCRPVL